MVQDYSNPTQPGETGASGTPSSLPGDAPMLPRQRWRLPTPDPALVAQLVQITGLSPLLAQVLSQRGVINAHQATEFLNPEELRLPSPLAEFPDLEVSLELLRDAIATESAITICGDYDADGMTSTALLLRALRLLGAQVSYTIPSRMGEGYGINQRIVEDCHRAGVGLILTVDNGIAARDPITRARELGLAVIVTDHHDIPPQLPPANAILNPKLLPHSSPYRGMAGVGVAYILAICLAQALNQTQDLTAPLLELFTLGTIADLAPLIGVNRRWVRRGLSLLPRSRILGIQALIEVAGLADQNKPLKPEHIGFRLGPRINAVGRLSDPEIVIDLLTTDDVGRALERAMQCEQINTRRQELCQEIEQEAIAWCEQQQRQGTIDLLQERVLLVVQPRWHHGVIGIVASRLVERYGVPVFIGTYEDDEQKVVRGSARGIPEFDVFGALETCSDLLEKFGGHRAAGGFSFAAKHLRQVKSRLVNYACQQLTPDLLKPLVCIDAQASLRDLTPILYDQIDHLHPCGIENPDPIFWTPDLQVVDQQVIGRQRDHLKLELREVSSNTTIKAIAWRWGEYYPLPAAIDVAYKLKQNEWQGVTSLELELVGVRPAPSIPQPPNLPRGGQQAQTDQEKTTDPASSPLPSPPFSDRPIPSVQAAPSGIAFTYSQRPYWVTAMPTSADSQLIISNSEGQNLEVNLTRGQAALCLPGQAPRPINLGEPHYINLIQAGQTALELHRLGQLLALKESQLASQAEQILALQTRIGDLEGQLRSPSPGVPGTVDPTEVTNLSTANHEDPGPQVRSALGDPVWFCLAAATQAHLCSAWQSQPEEGADQLDYSGPAQALVRAVVEEILQPLLQELHQYSQSTGDTDLVTLATNLHQQNSLASLPPLLAENWQGFTPKVLAASAKPRGALRQTIAAVIWTEGEDGVDDTDRVLLDEFLQGWDHPMAAWLTSAQAEAAADLAQIHQLYRVALASTQVMPLWQYQLLKQLVLGEGRRLGIFQKVFGRSPQRPNQK